MKINLSDRLSAMAAMVLPKSVVADIGTDHGYLPAFLVIKGISSGAIASDVAESPLEGARQLMELLALGRKIDLRLGDGLKILQPGEADTVCIGGMGASTMIRILSESPEVLAATRRLILQPMRGANHLRRWLTDHQWKIIDEEIVFEEEIYYEIIVAEQGQEYLSPWEEEVGPVLLKKNHPLLLDYLESQIAHWEKVLLSMAQSTSPQSEEKKNRLTEHIELLKQVMACLKQSAM